MEIVLKSLRSVEFLNSLVARILKSFLLFGRRVDSWSEKWRLSGVVELFYLGTRFKIVTNADDTIANRIYYGQGWEDAEAKVFLAIAKKSKVIIDVGANSGVYSILAAVANPHLKIFSFEPNPVNFERLSLNLSINKLKNVTPVQIAVGNSEKNIIFNVQDGSALTETSSVVSNFAESFSREKMKEIIVNQTTLDSFIKKHNVKPNFIKIDVEYYEKEVLEGVKDFLSSQMPLIMCEVLVYDVIKSIYPNLSGKVEKKNSYYIENYFKQMGYFFYLISRNGLMRVDTLHSNPDGKNFLFSSKKSSEIFLPFNKVKELF